MKKLIERIDEKVLCYLGVAMGFMLAGSNITGYITALKYGVQYEPEVAFLPAWTASPIAMLVYGIVSIVLATVLIVVERYTDR